LKKVEIFISCVIDQFFPQVAWDMVKVLEHLGCQVKYNPSQTCCGRPAYTKGHREIAKEVATKFLEDFNTKDDIISIMPSCTSMVTQSYDTFFRNTSNHNRYRGLQQRVFEFSEYLTDTLNVETLPSRFHKKVAFHSNCQAINALGQKDTSIRLLKLVEGLDLVYEQLPGTCCGYAGNYAANNEKGSLEKAEQLLDVYQEAGADVVVSNDYHCLYHYKTIVKKTNRPLEFMHLAEVLAQGL